MFKRLFGRMRDKDRSGRLEEDRALPVGTEEKAQVIVLPDWVSELVAEEPEWVDPLDDPNCGLGFRESEYDIIQDWYFWANPFLRTPLEALLHHGVKRTQAKPPESEWGEDHGFWRNGLSPFSSHSVPCSSPIGEVEWGRFISFLRAFRKIVEGAASTAGKLARLKAMPAERVEWQAYWDGLEAKYPEFPESFFYVQLTWIPRVGVEEAKKLHAAGYETVDTTLAASDAEIRRVLTCDEDDLRAIREYGTRRSAIQDLRDLYGGPKADHMGYSTRSSELKAAERQSLPLAWLDGRVGGREIQHLLSRETAIGRRASGELSIAFGKGGNLCDVVFSGDRFRLQRNAKVEGVLLNGKPASGTTLKSGDVLGFEGETKLGPRAEEISFIVEQESTDRPAAFLEEYRDGASRIHKLGSRTTFGRFEGNDVVLDDFSVSQHHCEINFVNERYRLRDVESSSGLRVNRLATKACDLNPGDRIKMGVIELEFNYRDI